VKFKLDENLPIEILNELEAAGHAADSVHDEGLAGAPDPVILEKLQGEGRILLTMDKGIGNVRNYPPQEYPGIVLFRPPSSGRRSVFDFVKLHLPVILKMDLARKLILISGSGIRTR
jgi:predicted nuclease of predicted toxin-antitoxin system